MPYIKPNEDPKVRYRVTVMPTTTQHGFKAVRFIGDDVPDTYQGGFKYYDDNDDLILDLTIYNDYYSPNVYSTKVDEPEIPKPNNTPSGGGTTGGVSSVLAKTVQELKAQVASMETYTETKPVFIHDTEVIFDTDKTGAISANLTVGDTVVPCDYTVESVWADNNRYTNRITVTFEELEEVGEVTLYIVPTTE